MLRHLPYSFKNFYIMGLQQIWEIILVWGLNHQLMQAMLAMQIHVGVEFPVCNVRPLFVNKRS
jgi:hypothetical protein